jgi:Spy/CpxP family protein refolding chaperone
MRTRTLLLAAPLALLPGLALAQTAAPGAPEAPSSSAAPVAPAGTATGEKPHHDHAFWKQHRAEEHAKYEQLSAADKAKYDQLSHEIRSLRRQQKQLLGMDHT